MTDRFSYYSQLTCSQCERTFDHRQPQTFCPECKAPLLAGYDLLFAAVGLLVFDKIIEE